MAAIKLIITTDESESGRIYHGQEAVEIYESITSAIANGSEVAITESDAEIYVTAPGKQGEMRPAKLTRVFFMDHIVHLEIKAEEEQGEDSQPKPD